MKNRRKGFADNFGPAPPPSGGRQEQTAKPEVWEPPIPLGEQVALPSFPVHCLPKWMADWCRAEALATQTPVDLASGLCLATAGAALARKLRVVIRPGWSEPVNIFNVAVLPPGERKSGVFKDVLAPALEFEKLLQAEKAPEIAKAASEHRILEEKLKLAEKTVAKEEDPVQREQLKKVADELAVELEEHTIPEMPQLFVDDISPEELARLIGKQGGRMLLASAEGTVFEICKWRYSKKPNFDVFLKGHAGDPLRTNRVSRDADIIDNPALSCALAVQPDVIHGLIEESTMKGRGFLARWLYQFPTSYVGSRRVASPPVPRAVAENYATEFVRLWEFTSDTDIQHHPTEWEIVLSPGAEALMREFEEWLEPQLAEGEELSFLAGWANKLAGAIARIAGILHVANNPVGWMLPITEDELMAAIVIGRDYYLPHAKAAFRIMGANPHLKNARRVARWLVDSLNSLNSLNGSRVFETTRSKIHSDVLGGRVEVDEVDQVIKLLLDHDYLRPVGVEPRFGPGRKPSQKYQANPFLADSEKDGTSSDNSDNSDNWRERNGDH